MNTRANDSTVDMKLLGVRPFVRLIPAGVTRTSETEVELRATLLLTPALDDKSPIKLPAWPSAIAELLRGTKGRPDQPEKLEIEVRGYVPKQGEEFCPDSGKVLTPKSIRVGKKGFLRTLAKGKTELAGLWSEAIAPKTWRGEAVSEAECEEIWRGLAKSIDATLAGKRLQEGKIADTNPSPPATVDQHFGKDGQLVVGPTTGERKVATILSIPYADAALALDERRGEELKQSIVGQKRLPKSEARQIDVPVKDFTIGEIDEKAKESTLPDQISKFEFVGRFTPFPFVPPNGGKDEAAAIKTFEIAVLQKAIALNYAAPVAGEQAGGPLDLTRAKFADELKAARVSNVKSQLRSQRIAWHKRLSEGGINNRRVEAAKVYEIIKGAIKAGNAESQCGFAGCSAAASVGAARTDIVDKAIDLAQEVAEYGQWPQYEDQDSPTGSDGPQTKRANELRDNAGQAYFSIEGNPSLARTFCLAFDLYLTFDRTDLPDAVRYAILAAQLSGTEPTTSRPQVFTLTKLRRNEDMGFHFWPVTQAEFILNKDVVEPTDLNVPANCVSQFDGIFVMGGENCAGLPRYDVTSMDVRSALEAEAQRVKTLQSEYGTAGYRGSIAEAKLHQDLKVGPDFQSMGLTLLCRSVQQDAMRKLAATVLKCPGGSCVKACSAGEWVMHDADDVTNGFRVFIGMPDKNWETEWRPLTARAIRFGESGKGGKLVEEVLGAAVGPAGSPERIDLETALQAIPGRDLHGGEDDAVESMIEQTVAIWDGGPGGVDCTGVRDNSGVVEDVMPFGRVLIVPPDIGDRRFKAFSLRNGFPYRFAMAAVFAGGRSRRAEQLPQENAPTQQIAGRTDARANLYYPPLGFVKGAETCAPSVSVRPYVRAMRHTRIGAPTVLLPSGHANRVNGPMGYETTGKMIVRTLRGDTGDNASRASPDVSQRLVVVPNIPQAAAARHVLETTEVGVMDRLSGNNTAPAGGFDFLNYKSGLGGFPVVETTTVPGLSSEPHLSGRRIVEKSDAQNAKPGQELSNPVYQPRQASSRTDYYPDPAADRLVVRARRIADDGSPQFILDGAPQFVEVNQRGQYPVSREVLLSLRRKKMRDQSKPPAQDSVLRQNERRYISAGRAGDIVVGWSERRVTEIELLLAPGDQFGIEMWLVPSAWRLAHDFAPIQALAQRIALDTNSGDRTISNVLVDKGFPEQFAITAAQKFAGAKCGASYVGPGGAILPDTGFIMALAETIHDYMLCNPLPEISGLRTVNAIHAVNVVEAKDRPKILQLALEDPFSAPGCEATKPHAMRPLRAVRPKSIGDGPRSTTGEYETAEEQEIVAGSELFALRGDVAIDCEKLDGIEILAETEFPETPVFDDKSRGRSLAHRIAGTWPTELSTTGTTNGNGEAVAHRKASRIFGFGLGRDGRPRLPRSWVTLLRIEGLPLPSDKVKGVLSLDDYFLGTANKEHGVVSQRHNFPDTKARRMKVKINALARTAEHLDTVSRVAGPFEAWRSVDGKGYQWGELIPREPMPGRLLTNLSNEIEVILPASLRPATPEALAPVPVFEFECRDERGAFGGLRMCWTRRVLVRIPLGRGWFSSGADERLGIVLWPPQQLLGDHDWIAENRIPLRESTQCVDGRPDSIQRFADLPRFMDEDLGPGGRFVTRRGTDPVRRGKEPTGYEETQIFLSREAFPDLLRHADDPGAATFVPYVEMPLADLGDEAKAKGNPSADDGAAKKSRDDVEPTPPLAVALVTYAPLFDPEAEEWYVDVTLPPGKSADPFLRLGLVRYQQHTRPALRTSRPVTQWVQQMPDREVVVEALHRKQQVVVTVRGRVSAGRAIETGPEEESSQASDTFEDQQKDRDKPRMRLTAFTETESVAGVPRRDTLDLNVLGGDPRLLQAPGIRAPYLERAPVMEAGDIGVWTFEIPFSVFEAHNWQVKFDLAEVELFLPADFGRDEPMTREKMIKFDEGHWQTTGARFSLTVDVSELAPKTSASTR